MVIREKAFNPLSAKKVQNESDSILARVSLCGFTVPYHFSISITGGFAFGHVFSCCIYNMH